MTNGDQTFRHRVRLFARAGEIGVARACRELGYHRSWYYRWKLLVERHCLGILIARERLRPWMPNQPAPWLEQQVLAMALGSPGLVPRRLSASCGGRCGEGT
ncbi:MAG TPA: hypothetical protein VMW80_07145 [Candidatus Dormibacteraeota bacterium]|nr:hypothetical protein [Candidatus Dormibacteraeota bacterium]